jgi:hypothetical protein
VSLGAELVRKPRGHANARPRVAGAPTLACHPAACQTRTRRGLRGRATRQQIRAPGTATGHEPFVIERRSASYDDASDQNQAAIQNCTGLHDSWCRGLGGRLSVAVARFLGALTGRVNGHARWAGSQRYQRD